MLREKTLRSPYTSKSVLLLNTIIREEDKEFFGLTPSQALQLASERQVKSRALGQNPHSTYISWKSGSINFEHGTRLGMRLDTSLPGIVYALEVNRPSPRHRTHVREYLDIHGSTSVNEPKKRSLSNMIFSRRKS